jgi:hypothetical protein
LSVRRGHDGRLLIHCFGGCSPEAILRAAGLTWADLFDTPSSSPRIPRRQHWRDAIEAPLLAHERRVQQKLEPWAPVNDFLRIERQWMAEVRAHVSTIGDTEPVWAVLYLIAARERFVNAVEAELDDALEAWR